MDIAQIVMVLVLAGFNIMIYDMISSLNIKAGYRKLCIIASIIITVFVFMATSFSINLVAALIIWPLSFLTCSFLIQIYDYLFVNVLQDSAE